MSLRTVYSLKTPNTNVSDGKYHPLTLENYKTNKAEVKLLIYLKMVTLNLEQRETKLSNLSSRKFYFIPSLQFH